VVVLVTDMATDYLPDLDTIEPVPVGVPNHLASGESGEPRPRPTMSARSPFARGTKKPAAKAKTQRAAVPPLKASAKRQIARIYILIGGLIEPMNEILGQTIVEQADKCADSVFELAQTNEEFRRVINAFMTGSLGGAVIFAHLPILLAIVATASKNDKTKLIAGGTLMALKMGDSIDLSSLVPDDAESVDA
jgi:hypothetical protein